MVRLILSLSKIFLILFEIYYTVTHESPSRFGIQRLIADGTIMLHSIRITLLSRCHVTLNIITTHRFQLSGIKMTNSNIFLSTYSFHFPGTMKQSGGVLYIWWWFFSLVSSTSDIFIHTLQIKLYDPNPSSIKWQYKPIPWGILFRISFILRAHTSI